MGKINRIPLLEKYSDEKYEAGCDEAGRGCLAGPVFAAAVILPDKISADLISLVDDSKKINPSRRENLGKMIEREALAYAVASVSPQDIDRVNILNASIIAMRLALENLVVQPEFILVDGPFFKPYRKVPHQCVVRGDGKYLSIAAASILAKYWRDQYMITIHEEFPIYQWDKNKGYPTRAHLKALQTKGPCKYHRFSFGPIRQLQLPFSKF